MKENNKMSGIAKTILGISSLVVVLIMSSLVITACNTQAPTQPQAPEQTQSTQNNSLQSNQENTNQNSEESVSQPAQGSVVQNNQNNTSQNSAPESISSDKAKQLALSHAGVSASNAQRYHSKLDLEDGRRVYEIEFDAGGYEYDYEIDAKTGEILKFDKEIQ